MAFFLYASFPNSRNRPRPPTTNAITYQTVIAALDVIPTLVATGTSNRTYIILKNFSDTFSYFYIYARTLALDPSVVATFGVVDDLIRSTTTNLIYQKQDDGITTNWVVVTIDVVGQRVEALQSASLDSPQDIYCSVDDPGPQLATIGVDQGTG
jgi:hypothetical protein